MVATYSSKWGTGAEETVIVWTGKAWKPGAAAGAGFWQAISPMHPKSGRAKSRRCNDLVKGNPSFIAGVAEITCLSEDNDLFTAMRYGFICKRNASGNIRRPGEFRVKELSQFRVKEFIPISGYERWRD
jgi:hypothetical protein